MGKITPTLVSGATAGDKAMNRFIVLASVA
jgi:hypothetical protein